MQCLVSLSDGLAGYTFPLYNTLAAQNPPMGSTEDMLSSGSLDLMTLPETETARARLNCARDGERMLTRALTTLSFLLP